MANYEPTWDLDTIFSGGSSSSELQNYIEVTENLLSELGKFVHQFLPPKSPEQTDQLVVIIDKLQETAMHLSEFGAFVSCLSAQNVEDKAAGTLVAKRSELEAQYGNVLTELDQKFIQIDEHVWDVMLKKPPFANLAFVLRERREKVKDKLDLDQEALINDLAVDGYHAWGQMYDTVVGKMGIEVDGEALSVGQAANKLGTSDRGKRKEVFDKLQQAWVEQSDLFTETLNHLSGFRLQTYKHRGWDDVLKEPLEYNRMSEKTITAMWETISKYKGHYRKFLQRKANLLGLEQLSMYDVGAPIGESEQKMDYNEGAQFIIDQFEKFSPKLAEFTKMAFEKQWIEAEDRPGKRPGGFCTSFPHSEQTRIFMTYSGSPSNVATLAHELGHAYHQHVMNELPIMNQGYAMNVAETASTFAEMIVADAAVKNASNEREKIALLEDKVQRGVAFFMNIHSRFLFETRFYEERKQGTVSTECLNEMMVEAQKEAYVNSLDEYDPTFWASKLHFHITDVPFYNFPYTFGYLFSLGVYAKALEEGSDFEEKYIALLQDTGRMTVEDLAMKHLNVNLEGPEFWEYALNLCIADVEEFLELTS
ncbi:M3 family oligoendopeptidase [Halobacillus amylolyticus]|uniref:M3 family oligoendopeptidase n=1 Tax=Halobacillus amylolyticus TaxID=2932259 RepID=A0ABY4HG89_9BACI|nr:M3 family oligoendopeptidase [Halobacillus amylolyticus]UOR13393.1 M3 family oligoendopeptidase [Halobacillus amylolyticus]